MNDTPIHNRRREKGQSLVEVALFLPIFLVILAGLIEVSQLVITQNRVSQAARVSSRFGASGGQDEGMVVVALNTVTQTLGMTPAEWDMWVVRGQVNEQGTAIEPDTWEFNHAYGISNTLRFNDIDEATIQAEVMDELQRGVSNPGDYPALVGGIQFVGLYALHDINSILGLDAIPYLTDLYTIRGFSIMRQNSDRVVVTNGCDAFPIAVHQLTRSVNPPNAGGNPYPAASQFDYPSTPPTYASFTRHRPDIPLRDAREGDVFFVQQGFGSGNFGWLAWNQGINVSATTLAGSLTWPGDSIDYTNHNDGGQPATPLYPWVVRGYVNPMDTSDIAMHIGDWVAANTGSVVSNGVRTTLNGHIDKGRQLRLLIWNDAAQQGSNGRYQIIGFAVFRLHGYSLDQGGGGSWILAEFISWDTSCGQIDVTP